MKKTRQPAGLVFRAFFFGGGIFPPALPAAFGAEFRSPAYSLKIADPLLQADRKGKEADREARLHEAFQPAVQPPVFSFKDSERPAVESEKEAMARLEHSAGQGDPLAQYQLAMLHESLARKGIHNQYPQYSKRIRQAALRGLAPAVQAVRKEAMRGFAEYQYTMGLIRLKGLDGEKNYGKALSWFRAAAAQGYAAAQYELAIMLLKGLGAEKAPEEALKWLLRAAAQGHADAQYKAGLLYFQGAAVEKDYEKALELLVQAAAQGHVQAQGKAGLIYLRDLGPPRSFQEAVRWLRKAADQKHPRSLRELGFIYLEGRGAAQDLEAALELFWTAESIGRGREIARRLKAASAYGSPSAKKILKLLSKKRREALAGSSKANRECRAALTADNAGSA